VDDPLPLPGSPPSNPFDDFYLLGDPVARGAYRASFIGSGDCGAGFSRAEDRPAETVRVPWAMGRATPSDVVWTTSALPMIVSARVIRILEEQGFTGWSTYPVAVSDKSGDVIEGYAGLAITGRCDPVDIARSSVVVREYPAGWFPKFRGRFLDLESWDGSDLFMERPDDRGDSTLFMYATALVARALRRAKVRPLVVTRLTDFEMDAAGYGIGKPNRMPADFEQRVTAAYARQGVPRPARQPNP
jgi:hypothetical protein